MRREPGERPVRRILVRCPNWLGDVVMATPGLRALRHAHPEARIVAQVPSTLAPLLEGSGLVDAIWPLASRGGGLAGWRADIRRVASEDFDLGVVLPESISSALLMRFGRVREVVGFARDPLRRWLLDRVVTAPAEWGRRRMVSRERFVLKLMAALGANSGDRTLTLAVTAREEARLADAFEQAGVSPESRRGTRWVVIAPGASFGSAKCWPVERYAALADHLIELGQEVVLLGAPGESERLRAVDSAMERSATVLDGTLDVGGLKALLREARALVANDAGARHVAAAFGVPSVIFFGPTSVSKTADNLSSVEVLETEHDCRPCYRRECPIDHRCLRTIGVDEARQATARALLREPPRLDERARSASE